MFGNFFKKKPIHEVDVSPSNITYVSDIVGNGVDHVRFELTLRTSRFAMISNAWLAKVKYGADDTIRILLLIDSSDDSSNCRRSIAEACSDVIPMDIVFADMLTTDLTSRIKRGSRPLYLVNTKLFHCPLIVKAIDDASAPKKWLGAIVNMYVADVDHESALRRAVIGIANDGYEFVGVHDNRVAQLSPENWWTGHVLAIWPEYFKHFPTQDEIHSFILCGGMLKGPVLEWEKGSL